MCGNPAQAVGKAAGQTPFNPPTWKSATQYCSQPATGNSRRSATGPLGVAWHSIHSCSRASSAAGAAGPAASAAAAGG